MTVTSHSPDEYARIRARESRIEFLAAWSFTPLAVGTTVYIHHLFSGLAPPLRLWTWTGVTGTVFAAMAIIPVVIFYRKPDDLEMKRVWVNVGKVVGYSYDVAIASSVWLLLPYASEPLRLLMVVFYCAAISGQVISTAESTDTISFGVLAVLGGAAVFFLRTPGPYSVGLAVFLLTFGGLMIGLAVTLKVAMRSAIVARMQAEAASEDLADALTEVTAARDAKTRFIATASHDLRQPLQAGGLYFKNLLQAKTQPARDRAAQGVRLAFEEAEALVKGMLEHLRLDAGAIEARLQPVSAGEAFARAVGEAGPIAELTGVGLSAAGTRARILADPALTGRALLNYIHNALRHAQTDRILLVARRRGDRVRLYVLDAGCGVPEAEREAIFEAYAQGAETVSSGRGGLGLGLNSARLMADLMNGEAGLDARWRRGSAFYLELPAA